MFIVYFMLAVISMFVGIDYFDNEDYFMGGFFTFIGMTLLTLMYLNLGGTL